MKKVIEVTNELLEALDFGVARRRANAGVFLGLV